MSMPLSILPSHRGRANLDRLSCSLVSDLCTACLHSHTTPLPDNWWHARGPQGHGCLCLMWERPAAGNSAKGMLTCHAVSPVLHSRGTCESVGTGYLFWTIFWAGTTPKHAHIEVETMGAVGGGGGGGRAEPIAFFWTCPWQGLAPSQANILQCFMHCLNPFTRYPGHKAQPERGIIHACIAALSALHEHSNDKTHPLGHA